MRRRFTDIALPGDERLCEPSQGCVQKLRCGRYMGAVRGHAMHDFSTEEQGGLALCPGFYDLRRLIHRPRRTEEHS